jgi:pre-rRNA-processing protein TSR4
MNLSEEIVVGVAKKCKPNKKASLESKCFPSKVGGHPAWLAQKNPPKPLCPNCGKCMKFLLQLYCPLEYDHAYIRTLYVFLCPEEKCCKSTNCVTVFRNQLPLENAYYTALDDDDTAEYKSAILPNDPELVFNKEEYIVDSSTLEVEETTKLYNDYQQEKGRPIIGQEENDNNDDSKSSEEFKHENELLKKYLNEGENDEDGEGLDKLVLEKASQRDDNFEKYRKLTSIYQSQILRYCRSSQTEPLWICDKLVPDVKTVPKCSACGSKRIFEFQINSQILNLYQELALYDWGVIAVYTCEKSCDIGENYALEYNLLQMQADDVLLDDKALKEIISLSKQSNEGKNAVIVDEASLKKVKPPKSDQNNKKEKEKDDIITEKDGKITEKEKLNDDQINCDSSNDDDYEDEKEDDLDSWS